MTQNFIKIDSKGNYYVITTGWTDLITQEKNFTGQFDFPIEKTSFIGYKNLTGADVVTTGVSITCDVPFKRINMRSQILTQNEEGESSYIDNAFFLEGVEVMFSVFLEWLYVNTGGSARNIAIHDPIAQ